jgi:hypothetical protein
MDETKKTEKTEPEAKPVAARKVKVGDKVHIVHADGKTHLDAKVIDLRKDGTIDVELMYRGGLMEIHSSPCDPTGTKPDCWHFPEAE